MAIIRIVQRNEKREDDTYPLAIRINKDGKISYIYLKHAVKKADWDKKAQVVKKSHPNHARLNNYLANKIASAKDRALELETKKEDVSVSSIRSKIKPKTGETFFSQADDYINLLVRSKKFNIYSADNPRINKFRKFLKGQDIAFSDITVGLLKNYKAYLKSTKNKFGKYVNDRTITNHLVVIRSVYAHAKANGMIIAEEHYPFGKGKIQIKFQRSKKVGLEKAEVALLEDIDLTDQPLIDHARNVWLTAFYFAGTRVGDTLLLKCSDFQNGRLNYTMGKNGKNDDLKVPERAQRIIDKYMLYQFNHDLVFPDLESVDNINDNWEVQRRLKIKIKSIDQYLKQLAKMVGITKKLTMHIARHTFGHLAGNKISLQSLQKFYRHTDIKTTMEYQQNFIHEEMDEALDKVLGIV